MDTAVVLDLASQVVKLKMFPLFDVAHSAMTCLGIREDLGIDAKQFSAKHPLACWISCMISVFSGAILSALLLGEPMLSAFKSSDQLLVATGVWYLVFYTPFDIGYHLAKFLPVKCVLSVMKEVYRCKKVNDGVNHVAKLYPTGYLPMLVIGTLKGNGGNFMKVMERLLRGVWTPNVMETLRPSLPTKLSFLAAVIFVLKEKTDVIAAPHTIVYFGIVVFFVYFKLSSLLLGIHDPLAPLEKLCCTLLFGSVCTGAKVEEPVNRAPKVADKQPKKPSPPAATANNAAPVNGGGDHVTTKLPKVAPSNKAKEPPAVPKENTKSKELPVPKPQPAKKKDTPKPKNAKSKKD